MHGQHITNTTPILLKQRYKMDSCHFETVETCHKGISAWPVNISVENTTTVQIDISNAWHNTNQI